MQFLVFILAVSLTSLPALSLLNAFLFSVGVLLFLTVGQILFALPIGLLNRNVRPGEAGQVGFYIVRIFTVALLVFLSFRINPYLVVPAIIGSALQWLGEFLGKKKKLSIEAENQRLHL
jgi:hypothetical protein